jgi:superfamily II DNA or RNA helicase
MDFEIADWLPPDDAEAVEDMFPEDRQPADPDYDYTRDEATGTDGELYDEGLGFNEPTDATLRPYQERAVRGSFEGWIGGRGKNALIVHPTGTGKTYTGAAIVARYPRIFGPRPDGHRRRILWLAHRDYLLDQAARTLVRMGVDSAIEAGRKKALAGLFGDPNCVIASVASMQENRQTDRLFRWEPNYVDLVVVDEGHRVLSPIYKRILHYFDYQHGLILTATPDRSDGRNLGEVVDFLADEYSLEDAVEDRWVCELKVRWCNLKIDISKIKSVGKGADKDLSESDLGKLFEPYVGPFANAIQEQVGQLQCILFAPTVQLSYFMATALTSLGIKSEHLDAKSKNRDEVLAAYRSGQIRCLCNYGLFTEGFDVPGIGAVILMRPTKSRGLYYQMVGRGLRPNDGQPLIVVDFPWVSGKHRLVKPADIFHTKSSKYREEVFREAERLLDVGGYDDVLEAIKAADEEITYRERFRLEVQPAKVQYTETVYNPLSARDVARLPRHAEVEAPRVRLASPRMAAKLKANGVPGGEAMSFVRAMKILDTISAREAWGGCSYGMIQKLVDAGYDRRVARKMTTPEANRALAEAHHIRRQRGLF